MGRILEILSRPPARGTSHPENDKGKPTAEHSSSSEIPYIEVGGPRREVEASASVRAAAETARAASSRMRSISNGTATTTHVNYRPHSDQAPLPAPHVRITADLLAFHQPHHASSEQYRQVLGNLVTRRMGLSAPVVLFASPVSGLGTTTTLLNLAITHATMSKVRVLVVDGNLRQPHIAQRFGLKADPGLREVISRSAPFDRAVQESGVPGLFLLSAGSAITRSEDWPSGQAFQAVIREAKPHFDWIVVDSPARDGGPEVLSWITVADVVYLVVPPDLVESPAIAEFSQLMHPLGSCLGGFILVQR